MSHEFKNKLSFLSDSSLYMALEAEDFERLKDLQSSNETRGQQKYFINKIKELLRKKSSQSQSDEGGDDLIAKYGESLKDLIVGVNEFTIVTDIAHGAFSVVYKGCFKFLDVAIKKVPLNTIFNNKLVL